MVDPIWYSKTREVVSYWSKDASHDLLFRDEMDFFREFISDAQKQIEKREKEPPRDCLRVDSPADANKVKSTTSTTTSSTHPTTDGAATVVLADQSGTSTMLKRPLPLSENEVEDVGETNKPSKRKRNKWGTESVFVADTTAPKVESAEDATTKRYSHNNSTSSSSAYKNQPNHETTARNTNTANQSSKSQQLFEIPSDAEDEERQHAELVEEENLPNNCGTEPTAKEQSNCAEWSQTAAESAEFGDFASAVKYMTLILKQGRGTAMQFAKRAEYYLRLKKPATAVRDCNKALELNPDSAKAFRVRGKANRKLQRWDAARTDLETAQKLDFDEDLEPVRKFVLQKWKKLEEVRVKNRIRFEELTAKQKEDNLRREVELRRQRVLEERQQQEKAQKEAKQKKKEEEDEMLKREKQFEAFLSNRDYGGVGPATRPFQGNTYKFAAVPPNMVGQIDPKAYGAAVSSSSGMASNTSAGAPGVSAGKDIYAAYGRQPSAATGTSSSGPKSNHSTLSESTADLLSGFYFDPTQDLSTTGAEKFDPGFEAFDPCARPDIGDGARTGEGRTGRSGGGGKKKYDPPEEFVSL
ncbi:unnamed protein product [Amoebophrya sp. A120]|nr:unnamed protein product [Amoebophrya sp. A120]|eukprot:GSA120T00008046001.1